MNRILFIITVFLMLQSNSYAINWQQVETPLNRIAYVDVDSITPYKNFYFYNIKFQNPNESEFVIMTMQSSKFSPLSARIKAYKEDEYNALDRNYKNITSDIRQSLEPVTFKSVVYSCYKLVDGIMKSKEVSSIIINNETDAE